jgi:hypothetical protein
LALARNAEAPRGLDALLERHGHEAGERNSLIDSQVARFAQQIVWY